MESVNDSKEIGVRENSSTIDRKYFSPEASNSATTNGELFTARTNGTIETYCENTSEIRFLYYGHLKDIVPSTEITNKFEWENTSSAYQSEDISWTPSVDTWYKIMVGLMNLK